jgi:hypothetical protein
MFTTTMCCMCLNLWPSQDQETCFMELNLFVWMEQGTEDLPTGKKKAGKPADEKDVNLVS